MNLNKYPEIRPGKKHFKRFYLSIMLWTVGKAIPIAAKVDPEVKKEFDKIPKNYRLRLIVQPERALPLFFYAKSLPEMVVEKGLLPCGLQMILYKDKAGKIHYQGADPRGKTFDLTMAFKNLEATMMVFTFRESTPMAYAHDRFIVEGYLPYAVTIMRILDIVQVYLLPKFIASLAVKRYPGRSEMSPVRKHLNRIIIYLRAFTF